MNKLKLFSIINNSCACGNIVRGSSVLWITWVSIIFNINLISTSFETPESLFELHYSLSAWLISCRRIHMILYCAVGRHKLFFGISAFSSNERVSPNPTQPSTPPPTPQMMRGKPCFIPLYTKFNTPKWHACTRAPHAVLYILRLLISQRYCLLPYAIHCQLYK